MVEVKSTIERDLNNMRSDLEDIDNVDTVSKAQLTDNNNYALFTIIPEKRTELTVNRKSSI